MREARAELRALARTYPRAGARAPGIYMCVGTEYLVDWAPTPGPVPCCDTDAADDHAVGPGVQARAAVLTTIGPLG